MLIHDKDSKSEREKSLEKEQSIPHQKLGSSVGRWSQRVKPHIKSKAILNFCVAMCYEAKMQYERSVHQSAHFYKI